MRKTILTAAAFLTGLSAAPAPAQTAVRSQAVSTVGLDLASPAGRARFQRRLAGAIEAVCGSYAGASDVEMHEIGRCRRAALADVDMQLAARDARRGRAIHVAAATR